MAKRKVVRKINNVNASTNSSSANTSREQISDTLSGTGTIRSNLERYRSDDVERVKARQGQGSAADGARKRQLGDKEKKVRKKRLIIRLCVTAVVLILCAAGFSFMYWIFHDVPVDEDNKQKIEVTITEGITDAEVGDILKEEGCIKDKTLYKLRTIIYDANYVPGVYDVSPSYTTEKIINILSGYDYSTDGLMEEE